MSNLANNDSGAKYRVLWTVSPIQNVEITCSMVSGLAALARAGEIELNLVEKPDTPGLRHTMRFRVARIGGDEIRHIGVEVLDRSDSFCLNTLEAVDVYFKRNFLPKYAAELPPNLRKKIKPAGVTFGCYVPGTRRILAKSAFLAFAGRTRRFRAYTVRSSLRQLASDLEQIRCFLADNEWERRHDIGASSRVIFQTRVWHTSSQKEIDRTPVNNERIALVRALRKQFCSEDTIGLLDTKSARLLAPDAILSRKVTRKEYADQLRSSLIAVNSDGLDGSSGFKVAESLAAGCALVSQPFKIELPDPLVPGTHYLPYNTAEECVEQCQYLLDNRAVAEEMRARNLDYYQRNIRPEVIARNLLEAAFATDTLVDGSDESGVNETVSSIG